MGGRMGDTLPLPSSNHWRFLKKCEWQWEWELNATDPPDEEVTGSSRAEVRSGPARQIAELLESQQLRKEKNEKV